MDWTVGAKKASRTFVSLYSGRKRTGDDYLPLGEEAFFSHYDAGNISLTD